MLPDAIRLCDVRHRGHPASLFAIGIDQGRDVKSGIENAAVFAFNPDLKAALNGVNLDISKGEFVFLVGLSGSGKSTFLRLVLREERPTTGVIHVAGKDLSTLAAHKVPELRRQVGTVFQDFRLLPNKTVSENVAFTLHVLGYSNKQISREVPEVLELVGLEEKGDRKPNELSGGEQQRVAIARAYVSRPTILIADQNYLMMKKKKVA